MNIPIGLVFNIIDSKLSIPDDLNVIFLCGVKFDSKSSSDKRAVLKKYLDTTPTNRSIILEEYFSDPRRYSNIGLSNLHDVETLVACFSNAVIIIHESLSTAAEIGMLASNRVTADKMLVLHPSEDSVEEDKISGFIRLAYYIGREPILRKSGKVEFSPLIQRNYTSNDRFVIHTSFPNDFSIASKAKTGIDDFLSTLAATPLKGITFKRKTYSRPKSEDPAIVDYYLRDESCHVYIHPLALRSLLFSLLTVDSMKENIEHSDSIYKLIEVFDIELKKILLRSMKYRLGVEAQDISIYLKGSSLATFQSSNITDYRKALGLFTYLLEAMGYLDNKGYCAFKITQKFIPTRRLFEPTIVLSKQTGFGRHIEESAA